MTTGNYPDYPEGSSAASSGGGSGGSSSGAKEQARQAAGTAAQESKHVADVAQGEAQKVASEASSQVRGLVSQASAQVEEQSRTQLGRLAQTLRSFGEDLERMASQGEGPASGLAQEAADRTRGLASQLEGREPRDLLEDVRSFARRRPGAFLSGALVAGVVAGRLTRGAKAAQDGSSDRSYGGTPTGSPYGSRVDPARGRDLTAVGSAPGPDGFAYESAGVSPDPAADPAGLPNPAASVAGGATYSTDTPGDRR